MLYSDVSNSARNIYDQSANYIFESLWPNKTNAREASEMLQSFYYSENARKSLSTLLAETTDVSLIFVSRFIK